MPAPLSQSSRAPSMRSCFSDALPRFQRAGICPPVWSHEIRPDIQRAEAQLHAATAGIGVARLISTRGSGCGKSRRRSLDAQRPCSWDSWFFRRPDGLSPHLSQGGRTKQRLALKRVHGKEQPLSPTGRFGAASSSEVDKRPDVLGSSSRTDMPELLVV